VLDPLYQAVCAEFPNACYVPESYVTAGGIGGDGIHPNDRGMRQIASNFVAAIPIFLAMYDPDNAYTTLQPGPASPLSTFIFAGAWGASNTSLTAGFDSMWYVSGGTVSAISIDNQATGLTSGGIFLKAGHSLKITHTAAPTVAVFDVSA
jgi:hypothetical protein